MHSNHESVPARGLDPRFFARARNCKLLSLVRPRARVELAHWRNGQAGGPETESEKKRERKHSVGPCEDALEDGAQSFNARVSRAREGGGRGSVRIQNKASVWPPERQLEPFNIRTLSSGRGPAKARGWQ